MAKTKSLFPMTLERKTERMPRWEFTGHRVSRIVAFIVLASGLSGQLAALYGQQAANTGRLPLQSAVRCPNPADPNRTHPACRSLPFEFFEETLTKDWGGLRHDLREIGITPTASYTAQLLGNVTGGRTRGSTYSGTLQTSLFWDVAQILRLPGLSLHVSAAWSTGKSLSSDYVGNLFPVQSAYTSSGGSNNVTFGELYFQQKLFDQTLTLAAGRLAPANTFATMPVLGNYLNAGIDSFPGSLDVNDVAFASYPPGVEWGAQAVYNIAPQIELAAGVFNNSRGSAQGRKGGLDFTLQRDNRGALVVGQVNYLFHHEPNDRGLPGQYSFGGFYDSNKFTSLRDGRSGKSGTYAVYALLQQMVYREGDPDSQEGLTLWAETAIAPKASVNIIPTFFGAGLSYQGLIPERGDDIASLGVIFGSFSRYVPKTSAETVLETNYKIALYRWLSITPDLQFVRRPSGKSGIDNAVVLGIQLAIAF